MSVTLHTNKGDLKIEVYCESVPKTAEVCPVPSRPVPSRTYPLSYLPLVPRGSGIYLPCPLLLIH